MREDPVTVTTKTRTYEYSVTRIDPTVAAKLSGLEYMQAMLRGEVGAKPSISDTVGMSVPIDIEHGKAAVEAQPADFLLNPQGSVHGGWAATVLDSVLGISIFTALPPATGFTTAELKINYTRAILPTTGRLRAEGNVVHLGRQMATAEARLVGIEDGKLYAHGSTTCFVFPLSGKG